MKNKYKKLPVERECNLNLKNKFNFKEIVIGIALVLILITGSYALNYYLPQNNEINLRYYNQGGIDLYNRLISELTTCNPVPLRLDNNQTVNAILVECLQQGG